MKPKNEEFENFDQVMHKIIQAPHLPITKRKIKKKESTKKQKAPKKS